VAVGVPVGVAVDVSVGVEAAVAVVVGVALGVNVPVGVAVDVGVSVLVSVAVLVGVAVGVGAATVVVVVTVLFAGAGSRWVAATLAVLLSSVPAVAAEGTTVTVIWTDPPPKIRPRLQASVVVPLQVPWLGVADTKLTPGGRVSVTTTLSAIRVSRLRTVRL
jgi:hypothetical protein